MKETVVRKKDTNAIMIGLVFLLIYAAAYFDPGINTISFIKWAHIIFGPIAFIVVYQVTDRSRVLSSILALLFPSIALIYFGVIGKEVNTASV